MFYLLNIFLTQKTRTNKGHMTSVGRSIGLAFTIVGYILQYVFRQITPVSLKRRNAMESDTVKTRIKEPLFFGVRLAKGIKLQ